MKPGEKLGRPLIVLIAFELLAMLALTGCSEPRDVARCLQRCDSLPDGCQYLAVNENLCRCSCTWDVRTLPAPTACRAAAADGGAR